LELFQQVLYLVTSLVLFDCSLLEVLTREIDKRKSGGSERTTAVAEQVGRLSRRVRVNLTKVFVSVNNLYFLLFLTSETIFWVRCPVVVFSRGSWFLLRHQNSCVHCFIDLHILMIIIVARSKF
jgi:hypothetical protein